MTSNPNSTEPEQEPIKDIDLIKPELFDDALEKLFGKCKITEFDVKMNSGAGENYVAQLYFLNINVEKEDRNIDSAKFVAKLMPPNSPQAQFMKHMLIFEKEAEMYENVVPKLEAIYHENGVNIEFTPRFWKTITDPEILIMDDLKAKGFRNLDRLKGLDMRHSKAVLIKLAKFHAASACVYEKSGPFPKMFMDGLINDANEEGFRQIQPAVWANVVKNLKKWETCQEYVTKLANLQDCISDVYLDIFRYDPDEFNVLLHGDLWANNIMFRHDENGEIEEVLFVDLQITRYRSPVQDLIYFILSSTENAIKIKEFDFFIKFYHDELVKNLKLLKYPKAIPRLVDLHVSLLKRGFLGVATTVGVMAAALLDPNENANMDNFINDSEAGDKFKSDMYTNPRLIKACEIVFPFLDNKGLFDP